MIGVPALQPGALRSAAPSPPAAPPAAPAAQPSAVAAPQGLRGTMIGMPSPVRGFSPEAAPSPPATPPASAEPTHSAPHVAGGPRPLDRTQLGLGAPAVLSRDAVHSPSAAHSDAAVPPAAGSASPAASTEDGPRPFAGTLIGIAHPGIAPRHAGVESSAPRSPSVGPAPIEPAAHEPEAPAWSPAAHASIPTRPRARKPFPWLFVGLAFAAAASAGALVALLGKKTPDLSVVSFDMTSDGHDRLLVRCRNCAPGSKLVWAGSSAPLVDGQAHLSAPSRLHVGPNTVPFEVLDPSGKKHALDVTVPIAFRVETEFDGRLSNPPFATVVVEAPEGAEVTVDGKPIPGKAGSFRAPISLAEFSLGESRERVPIQRNVPVRVTDKGTPRDSSARLQTSVASLELATPANGHVLASGPLVVSGHTDPGALVRVGIQTTKADASGDFLLAVTQPRVGDLVVGVEKDGAVSRFVQLRIDAASTRVERPFDAKTDIGAFVDFSGNIVEIKIDRGRTIAVLEAESGCDAPPCAVSLQFGQARTFAIGRTVYGVAQLTGREPIRMRATWIQSQP